MLKKCAPVLGIITFLITCFSNVQAQEASNCAVSNSAFQPGEVVRYKLYYNWNFVWVPAGEVVFSVEESGELTKLKAIGTTYKSYEWFFKVHDRYESYIDPTTMLPALSVRDIKEGNFSLYDRVEFDRNKNFALSTRGKDKSKAVEKDPIAIESCVHDMLSVIYFARNLEYPRMAKNEIIPVSIFLDNEVYPLEVKYKGVENEKKIKGLGTFETYVFSPATIAGEVFKEGDQMKVWVSKDNNRLPLLIESPIAVGSIKAVLMDFDGLRYAAPKNLNP